MPSKPSNNIETWVNVARDSQREFRQAVHVILCAIAHAPELRNHMIMKGGILLALRYQSPRFTKDIDFSTSLTRPAIEPQAIKMQFERALPIAADMLDYGLHCLVQGVEIKPTRADATFPTIRLRIGYATKGTPKHKRLLALASPDIISIDFSLNEPIINIEDFSLEACSGETILTYALTDLIAEKIRSLLQQEERNRFRRQDVYDLEFLLRTHPPASHEMRKILDSLRQKASSRDIDVFPDSLANEGIRQRARRDYATLADEVEGPLPDFDSAYGSVELFYRALPWNIHEPDSQKGL